MAYRSIPQAVLAKIVNDKPELSNLVSNYHSVIGSAYEGSIGKTIADNALRNTGSLTGTEVNDLSNCTLGLSGGGYGYATRGGVRPGAGRPTNADKGLELPRVVIAARISPTEAAWANDQVANNRFRSISAYIEHLIHNDRSAR